MEHSDDERHHKPLVLMVYGDCEAYVGIDGEVPTGSLSANTFGMVYGWMAFHEDELYAAWNNAVRRISYGKMPPLQQEVIWSRKMERVGLSFGQT